MFWLHAGSAARLKQSIKNTLEQVQVPGSSDPTVNVFQLFRAWLLDRKQRRTWLIILDNADDSQLLRQSPSAAGDDQGQEHAEYSERYLDYIPVYELGTLLATSRNRATALQIVSPNDIIDIGPMDKTQGLAMLQQKLGPNIIHSVDELSQLATELDLMPLAMSQAAAYIRRRAPLCSVREYHDKLTSHETRLDVLNHNTQDLRRDHEAKHCILTTWQISFDHIRQSRSSAADLLSLMSFFDRNSIPEALLHNRFIEQNEAPISATPSHFSVRRSLRNYFARHSILKPRPHRKHDRQHAVLTRDSRAHSGLDDKVVRTASPTGEEPIPNLDDDIQLLRDYSLVTVVTGSPSFQMHRLVQLATQDWLKATQSYERWGSQFIQNLDEALPGSNFEYWEVCQPLLPHVFAAMEIEVHNRDFALRQASVLDKGAWHAFGTGTQTDSQKTNEQALKISTELLGPEHMDTICLMTNLGMVYIGTQQYEKAETMLAKALKLAERLWEQDHESTLRVMIDLALAYSRNGKLVYAETMQIKILLKLRKSHGEEDIATLNAMMGLSETASKRRRNSEAEDLASRALSIARKLYNARHPQFLNALHLRAKTQYRAGRFAEARRSFDELFLRSSESLGVDHPVTLTSVSWLAGTMYRLGQLRSAIDLLRDCAEKSERKLGPHHSDTVAYYDCLRRWEAEDEPRTIAREQEEPGTDDGSDMV